MGQQGAVITPNPEWADPGDIGIQGLADSLAFFTKIKAKTEQKVFGPA